MKLRTQLFLWIGSLFLLVTLLSCLVPRFIIQKDLNNMISSFENHVQKELSIESRMHEKSFQTILDMQNLILTRTLLYLYEDASIQSHLNPLSGMNHVWQESNKILAFSPEISFLQLSSQDKIFSGISLENSVFYNSWGTSLTNSFHLISLKLQENTSSLSFGPFLGIRFPLDQKTEHSLPRFHTPFEISADDALTIYYLYPIEELFDLSNEELQKITLFSKELLEKPDFLKEMGLLESLKNKALVLEEKLEKEKIHTIVDLSRWIEKKKSYQTISSLRKKNTTLFEQTKKASSNLLEQDNLMNVTREYIYYMLTTIDESPFEIGSPLGATSYALQEQKKEATLFYGKALLNQNIFFENPRFDAADYYKNYPPLKNAPIAGGIAFLESDTEDLVIAKVLKISKKNSPDLFLTIGQSIIPRILEMLPTPKSLAIFFSEDGSLRFAIDASGNVLNNDLFSNTSFTKSFDNAFGTLKLNQQTYHYYTLGHQNNLPIRIFILSPASSESLYYFEGLMIEQMQHTGNKLFSQILVLGLFILGVALVILAILSSRISQPISMISFAAEEIAAGHFFNLKLPHSKNQSEEISILTSSFSRMILGLETKEKIRGLLDKVVSKEIASEILKGGVQLGGELKQATILFSDIRGYTHMTENVDPKLVIKHLNYYMTEMSQIIEKEGGVIDKYVGDEIMALYGVPLPIKNAVDQAVKTALLMMEKLPEVNEVRAQAGRPSITIGIGVHTGEVIAGNMGAETRLNYTVLGSTVNLASRLCSAAAPMEIRISKETLDQLTIKDLLVIQEIEATLYKGFSHPIVTYAIKGLKTGLTLR